MCSGTRFTREYPFNTRGKNTLAHPTHDNGKLEKMRLVGGAGGAKEGRGCRGGEEGCPNTYLGLMCLLQDAQLRLDPHLQKRKFSTALYSTVRNKRLYSTAL